ncbi:MAG: hypothetical protein ACLFP8_00710 [Alphaproteobacteria bacterium]
MFRIFRFFSLVCFSSLVWISSSFADETLWNPVIDEVFGNPRVPITEGDYKEEYLFSFPDVPNTLGEFITPHEQRKTCDPDMMKLVRAQAWQAGQRELSQNANIYTRPDSVLAWTCFTEDLMHQAEHSWGLLSENDQSFPTRPTEADGVLLPGLAIGTVVSMADYMTDFLPYIYTDGYLQYRLLELLVVDQLVGFGATAVKRLLNPGMHVPTLMCGYHRYLGSPNFDPAMLDGRAIDRYTENPDRFPGLYRPDPYYFRFDFLSSGIYKGPTSCGRMQELWKYAQCYDFASESESLHFYEEGTDDPYTWVDHDGFYPYEEYYDETDTNYEFDRVRKGCRPPDDRLIHLDMDAKDIACQYIVHGGLVIPSGVKAMIPSLSSLLSGFMFPGEGPFPGEPGWKRTLDITTSLPGSVPDGIYAGDAYEPYWDLIDSENATGFSCKPPIRTGLIVVRPGGSSYYDAVCPNPHCSFDAPSSLRGQGSCSFSP